MKIAVVRRIVSKKVGKSCFDHRNTGTRIKAEHGTAAFAVEVERLDQVSKATTATKEALGHLIDAYRKTPEFLNLKPVTKGDYERVLWAFEGEGDAALPDRPADRGGAGPSPSASAGSRTTSSRSSIACSGSGWISA
ncbi:hypothetical protein [Methylobacterium oxalidis]|nr:hypothetical protein [Methylobacterium oxalidis]